jgi:acetyl esterase/lipase
MSTGVQPQNIQITGDSAGGNLVLQLISHILHPLDGVRPLKLSAPIRGIYLMSPWVALTGTEGSMTSNDGSDIIGTKCINAWGKKILEGIPMSYLPYIEPIQAPEVWFKSLDTAVDRVLITAGSAECLRDPIEVFAKQICRDHDGATFWMQEHGVHDDPFLDFFFKNVKPGTLTRPILEWFATGFKVV